MILNQAAVTLLAEARRIEPKNRDDSIWAYILKTVALKTIGVTERNKALARAAKIDARPNRKVFILAGFLHVIDANLLTFLDINKIHYTSFVHQDALDGISPQGKDNERVVELLARLGHSPESIAEAADKLWHTLRGEVYELIGSEPWPALVSPGQPMKTAHWVTRQMTCARSSEVD